MKIKANGTINISIRKTDLDLRDLLEGIPEGGGSEVLRELIRDGIAYQQLVQTGQVHKSKLTALMDYYDIRKVFGDVPISAPPQLQGDREVTTGDKQKRQGTKIKMRREERLSNSPAENPETVSPVSQKNIEPEDPTEGLDKDTLGAFNIAIEDEFV